MKPCKFCRFPSEKADPANVPGTYWCSRCGEVWYAWPGFRAAIEGEREWWSDPEWHDSLRAERRDSGVLGAIGMAIVEWCMDHAHPEPLWSIGNKLLNNPLAVRRRLAAGRKD